MNTALPSSLDVSARFAPVRDQGIRQTCVAFACCAALEYRRGRSAHLSAQHGYYLCKNADLRPTTPGTWLSVGAAAVDQGGFWEECDWAYDPVQPRVEHGGPPPPGALFTCHGARAYEIHPPSSQLLLKEALARDLGVVITMELYSSWVQIGTSWWNSGNLRNPSPGVGAIGRHAVCLVGYDDAFAWPGARPAGAFLFRNSWGVAFGGGTGSWRPGYGRIGYDFVATPGQVTQAFAIE